MKNFCEDLFFFFGDRLKNFFENVFFFFVEHLRLCPWPRAFLSLASRVSVLGKAVLGLGLEPCVLDSTSDDETLHLKSRVDLSHLPSCKNSLIPHIYSVNHRIAQYKRDSNAIFESPKPFDLCHSCEKTEDINLKPIWSCGPILLSALIDMIAKTIKEVEEDEHQEESEIDNDDYNSDDE